MDYSEIYPQSRQHRTTPEQDEAFLARVRENALNLARARGLTLEGTTALVAEHVARATGPHLAYQRSVADGHMVDSADGEPVPGGTPSGGSAA